MAVVMAARQQIGMAETVEVVEVVRLVEGQCHQLSLAGWACILVLHILAQQDRDTMAELQEIKVTTNPAEAVVLVVRVLQVP
jgi:hypothetical protein